MHAGEVGGGVFERSERGAQLLRVRPVFGVVDDDIFATRVSECRVERLRLRARCGGRYDDDFDMRCAGYGDSGGDGVDIIATLACTTVEVGETLKGYLVYAVVGA